MRFLDRRTIHRADRVCVLSKALSADLRERTGLPADRIAVIPNGIDTAAADRALAAAGEAARAGLGLSHADLVVASIGRLHRQKGFDVLLEAFRPLALAHPRGRLIIAGEGPERAALEEKAAALGIAGRVLFTGAVSSPWNVLAAADIFVLPSRYEGMPNALLEAMAAALPVVATGVGAVPEMIEDSRQGFVVPPQDPQAIAAALDRLSWSPDLRKEMGRRGRETAKGSFSPAAAMDRLVALYESLL
jgi:glycosyltransferase involved in cell wall biosynthesis